MPVKGSSPLSWLPPPPPPPAATAAGTAATRGAGGDSAGRLAAGRAAGRPAAACLRVEGERERKLALPNDHVARFGGCDHRAGRAVVHAELRQRELFAVERVDDALLDSTSIVGGELQSPSSKYTSAVTSIGSVEPPLPASAGVAASAAMAAHAMASRRSRFMPPSSALDASQGRAAEPSPAPRGNRHFEFIPRGCRPQNVEELHKGVARSRPPVPRRDGAR